MKSNQLTYFNDTYELHINYENSLLDLPKLIFNVKKLATYIIMRAELNEDLLTQIDSKFKSINDIFMTLMAIIDKKSGL